VVVLLATVGFSWMLDKLFNQVNANAGSILGTFESHGLQLASLINTKDPAETLNRLENIPGGELALLELEALSLPSELQDTLLSRTPLALESERGVTLYYYLPESGQVLSYLPPALQYLQRQNRQRIYFTVLFYTGLISLTLLWLYPLVKRLLNLSRVARSFGEGNLGARVVPAKRSYIADIESEFNRMAKRIETLISDNKLLTSAVSHDLRTPIARLRFGIDAVMETDDPAVNERYMRRISDDLTSMEELVEVILGYAHMEQQISQINKQRLNLLEAISRAVRHSAVDSTQIHWKKPPEKMIVEANEHYLGMLLNNVLGNAIKYGDGQVWLSLDHETSRSGSFAILKIEDNGPGIPIEQRDRLLRPFERFDSSKKGYGMGLAVVSRIAESMNASLSIDDSAAYSGAAVSIRFKLLAAEDKSPVVSNVAIR